MNDAGLWKTVQDTILGSCLWLEYTVADDDSIQTQTLDHGLETTACKEVNLVEKTNGAP